MKILDNESKDILEKIAKGWKKFDINKVEFLIYIST